MPQVILNPGAPINSSHAVIIENFVLSTSQLEFLLSQPRSASYPIRGISQLENVYVYVLSDVQGMHLRSIQSHVRNLVMLTLSIISLTGIFGKDRDIWSAVMYVLGYDEAMSAANLGDLKK